LRPRATGTSAQVPAHALPLRTDTTGALGRAGLVATAALYVLLGLLALRVALEGRPAGERPNTDGALRLAAGQPGGKVLLGLLMLGFAAHAVWRLAEAFRDRDREGDAPAGLAKRLGYAALGVWYAALAGLTGWLLLGHRPSTERTRKQATEGVFGWPFGRELVAAVGLGLIAAAIGSVVFVWRRQHLAKLHHEQMSLETERVANVAGRIGYASRAFVLAVIGGFLVDAAWTYAPGEAKGLDGALLRVVQAPLGPLLLAAVAVGFFAYAVWCLMQARYRAT
jgi:hypothetical protein